MSNYPKKPSKGDRVLQSIYDSVCDIIDYIPSLQIKGDNKTTSVSHSSTGTTIHANVKTPAVPQSKEGTEYIAGSGIQILSGNVLNAAIDNSTIKFGVKNGQYVLSCTLSGGGGGGPDTNDTYIGDANYYGDLSGNHVYITPNADYNGSHLVSSTLHWIKELGNDKLSEPTSCEMPNSLTACNNTVTGITAIGNHFMQASDMFHDGLGTTVNFSWERNSGGSHTLSATDGHINGIQVDLTLSGGKYADVKLHKHIFGSYDPNQGTRYDPPTQSTINVLLSGDGDVDPSSGHIFIRDVVNDNGTVGGIIYTDLQGGGGSNVPPPIANCILSCDNNGMTWEPNVAGGGGGSGFIPDWGHKKHDFGIPPTTYKPQHPTVAEHDGYLFAWASFNPSRLNYQFQNATAHIIVNDAQMKVCEVSYPDKFYIVANNNRFERYPYGDISQRIQLTGTTAGSGSVTQTIPVTNYSRSEDDDVKDQNNDYIYFAWSYTSPRVEYLPQKIYTEHDLLHPTDEHWDIYFKKYNVYEYQDGEKGSWLTSYMDGFGIDVYDLLQEMGYTGGWVEEAYYEEQSSLDGNGTNSISHTCWTGNDIVYTTQSVQNGTQVKILSSEHDKHIFPYYADVTDNNMKMQAIGVGGGLCVPFRKGATLSYVVWMDSGRTTYIPLNYGTSGMTEEIPACCIVYYNHST